MFNIILCNAAMWAKKGCDCFIEVICDTATLLLQPITTGSLVTGLLRLHCTTQGSIWDRNLGAGGGRRGARRAHNNYTQTGWIQDVGAERCAREAGGDFSKH